ncbi:GL19137 [Drosophila persimilis]|uniref:GL19137 n=1 Tax=Drosophila persimilis TaxID=7234 RepID=B4G762_DROPE|nr:GL19137 [Drosophila persimilis]
MTATPAQFEFLSTAGNMLEWHDNLDRQKPGLLELTGVSQHGRPTMSGLNDYDYQSLAYLKSDNAHNLKQLRTVTKSAIPNEILEHFKHVKCHCNMGLFPEIGRAWLTIDSEIYIWTYNQTRDVAYYDGLSHLIVSVGLVKPKPDVFVKDVMYLLVLTTPIEVIVLGVTFGENSYNEMQLMNRPIFVIGTDNVSISVIKGTDDGRIFLGGRDGCLYEVFYQAETSWFGKRCKKINLSQNLVSYMVPSFLRVFSEVDPIQTIAIDNSRRLLYILTENGSIEAWDIGSNYANVRRLSKITQSDITNKAVSLITTVDPSIFKAVRAICPLIEDESNKLHLVAVTQCGVRLYFSTTSLNTQQSFNATTPCPQTEYFGSGQPPLSAGVDAPKGLYLLHVRLPPGYTPNATTNKPREVHAAHYSEETMLMITTQQQDQDILWSVSSVPSVNHTYLVESTALESLDGIVWGLAEVHDPSRPLLNSPLYKARNPRRVALLTNQGTHIIELLKSPDILLQILLACNGPHHEEVKMFFQSQNKREACATCLLIATSEKYRGGDIALWATQAFMLYGGEPCFQNQKFSNANNRNLPNQTLSSNSAIGTERLPMFMSTPMQNKSTLPSTQYAAFQYNQHTSQASTRVPFDSQLDKTNGYTTMLMANSHLPMSDQRSMTEQAQVEEKRSLSALNLFVKHACEVISLWSILNSHSFQHLCLQLSPEHQKVLRCCTFRDLMLTRSEVCAFLIISLINLYLKDKTGVSEVSKNLRELCPNLYRHEDAVTYKATELLMSAKNCTSPVEKKQKLRTTLQMCKEAAPTLPLHSICQLFISVDFFEGVVELTAICASKSDPEEVGIHFYNNDEPPEDREGYSYFVTRMNYYKEVQLMLDHVYQATSINFNIAAQTLQIKDPLIHVTLYEWLLAHDMLTELLEVVEPTLGEFLRRSVTRNPDNVILTDLLWKYYEKNGYHSQAAKILDNLAMTRSENITLEQRIDYLVRAVMCMRNGNVGSSVTSGIFLKELEDKLEIARVQKAVLVDMTALAQKNPDASMAVKELNYSLYEITPLYQRFAEPFNLWECQLSILNCSHHNDPLLIESVWGNIISSLVEDPGSIQDRTNRLFSKIELLVREYAESGACFPFAFLIRELEIKACQLRMPEGTVPEKLVTMNLDLELILEYYSRMISMNERVWANEGNEWHLIQSAIRVVSLLADNAHAIWYRSKRRIIGKAQDIVAACLNICYQKPDTNRLQQSLKELQCRLQRLLG